VENLISLAMVALFVAAVTVLATALRRLVHSRRTSRRPTGRSCTVPGAAEPTAAARLRPARSPWSRAAPSARRTDPPGEPSPAAAPDSLENRFATAFSTVPARRREDLIAHALLRLGSADRSEAIIHLLDEKARGR
jgi:hypothetical protein